MGRDGLARVLRDHLDRQTPARRVEPAPALADALHRPQPGERERDARAAPRDLHMRPALRLDPVEERDHQHGGIQPQRQIIELAPRPCVERALTVRSPDPVEAVGVVPCRHQRELDEPSLVRREPRRVEIGDEDVRRVCRRGVGRTGDRR